LRKTIIFSILTALLGVALYVIYFQPNGATLATINETYLNGIPDVTIDPPQHLFF